MEDAALVFVREDSAAAERLAGALERAGVSVCRSASVFEDPHAYGAIVALFSPAAVKSRLVMDAAIRAREESRLIAVFVGLCPLPPVFSGIAMFDLSSWGDGSDDAAVAAVAAQIRRTEHVKAARAGFERGMNGRTGAAGGYRSEPRGLAAPPVITPAGNDLTAYAFDERAQFGDAGAYPAPYGGDAPPSDYGAPGYGFAGEARPTFGHGAGSYANYADAYPDPRVATPGFAPIAHTPNSFEDGPRPQFTSAPPAPPRRFAGLTPADDAGYGAPAAPAAQAAPGPASRAWADAWVEAELRSRGVAAQNLPAREPAHDYNQHAYRGFSGAGAAMPGADPTPRPLAPIAPPAGNSFDNPGARHRTLRLAEPWAREDRLGYERPAGAQDPLGAPQQPPASGPAAAASPSARPRRRHDSLFAILVAVGVAVGAAGAFVLNSGERATLASAPLSDDADVRAALPLEPGHQSAAATPAGAGSAPLDLRAVSLSDALGDSSKANREPSRTKAEAVDRGVERRRR